MKFYIIGIDDNQEQSFSEEVRNIIASHHVFSGGIRHHEIVATWLPEAHKWIDIVVPLDNVFDQYNAYPEMVVFASGDPLFFGFANTIQRKMPDAEMILYPFFNSLQLLAHHLLMPYQDMHVVSLTGRSWHKFDEALITGYNKIGVLTDSKQHTPPVIARRMLDYGYDNYTLSVGELLGNKEKEKVSVWELKDVINHKFAFPNNLILQRTYKRHRPLGIPEDEFNLLDGRAKMITKMPVRLLTLSMLDLRDKAVFWDIGFCTGSVSIEAKMQFPHLQVIAFEKREEGRALIGSNARRFGTPGIQSIISDFTNADISALPRPDAVFIGGHGGKMKEIIGKVSDVLRPDGIVIFNSVSEESRRLFEEAVTRYQLNLKESISVQIDDFNRIEVMKAIKVR
ncbi:MAG: precorrin-6y C5,15-methyltransferase (decarboxylating) subunit CbiE [Tannerellaceae bacterium]|jgi:precorrin-6Y C5,15-methyltransferase (decarboxylating)|nr:precorrin-6y C5,15-methyltransferase (decarboxylating) subunit CbiE [Tannerellaceae bacterium]